MHIKLKILVIIGLFFLKQKHKLKMRNLLKKLKKNLIQI